MITPSHIITVKEINIPEALIKLRSDGIVHVHYKKNTTVDLETQSEMREIFKDIRGAKKSHYIFSSEPGVKFTRETLENTLSVNNEFFMASYAIIANNAPARMIANFYLNINKPKIPHKLFSTPDEAVLWLRNIDTKSLVHKKI